MSNVLMQEIPPGKKKVEEIQANDSFHPNLLLLMGRVRLILYAIFFSRENYFKNTSCATYMDVFSMFIL